MTDKILVSEDGFVREATVRELEQFEFDKERQNRISNLLQAKATNRSSALAKLTALGLTEEEIAAL